MVYLATRGILQNQKIVFDLINSDFISTLLKTSGITKTSLRFAVNSLICLKVL